MKPSNSSSNRQVLSEKSSVQENGSFDFFRGGGEMGHLMRAKDWTATPLGDPSTWPQSLRTSVSTCLNCSFPILVWWGPDLIKLYNDAYAAIISAKHPAALGAKGRDVWPEVWPIIGPMLAQVLERGQATPANDLLLMLERNGYPEECYFSFSYSPIRNESGAVGGIFCPVIETTDRVIGQRRLQLLRLLATQTTEFHTVQDVLGAAAACLRKEGHHDFPFAAFYAQSANDGLVRLTAASGLSDAVFDSFDWPFSDALETSDPVIVKAEPLYKSATTDSTGLRAQHVVVLPLAHLAGFAVLGLSPHRPLEETRNAAVLFATQLSNTLASVLVAQAERERATALAEMERAKAATLMTVNEALAANEERLRRNLQQMPGFAAILMSPNHVFQYVNDAYIAISGPRDFLGRSVRDVFPELKRQGFYELLDQVFASGEAYRANALSIHLAGESEARFIDFVYEPIRAASGEVIGIFVGGYDVSVAVRAETALRVQRTQLQAVIDTVPAAVWFTHDRNAEFVQGNRYAARLLRLTPSANPSLTAPEPERSLGFRILRDEREVPADDLPMQRAARGELAGTEELEIRFDDGQSVSIEIQASTIRDMAGNIEGAVCTAIDITDRKRAEFNLRRSEEEFRGLAENQANLCWMADASGWIYWYNRRWFDYTGTTLDEMQGWGWQSVHDPAVLPEVMKRWPAAIAAGVSFNMTFPLRGADGMFRPFLTNVVPVRDDAGAVVRWFGNNVDVTAHQQAEARQLFFLELTDCLRDLSDPREIVAAAVSRLGRYLGVSRVGYGEVHPNGDSVRFQTDYANGVGHLIGAFPVATFGLDNIAELRRGLTTTYSDVTVDPRTSDADFAAIETRAAMAAPLIRDGRFRAVLYINHREVRDWTPEEVTLVQDVAARTWDALERARAETDLRSLNEHLEARVVEEVKARELAQSRLAQAQRMEALGQLAGGIAHDFNNVLQAVIGGLGLINRKAESPEEVRKLARMAIDASDRGAAITGRLLSFARRGELQPIAVDTLTLLDGLREILIPTLGVGIEISLEIAECVPPLLADKSQLETVLINLAVNARDAMPTGGKLTISATAETVRFDRIGDARVHAGEYLRIDLEDNGAGMDAAVLKRASEPFFTTKPSGQGTGLGLSMARGFAEQSNGGFSISSELGIGTKVTLWFPTATDAGEPAKMPLENYPILSGAPGRALVVDDDPMVREILSQQVKDMGFDAILATDGLDALNKLDSGLMIDVLVTDYSMPGMNGLTLIDESRLRQPNLPAVLLTGFADAEIKLKFEDEKENGFTALVRKPIEEDQLARKLAAVLSDTSR